MSSETAIDPIDPLLAELGELEAVNSILEVVCRTTHMGFAAVAHVSEDRWVAAQVRDEIGFGLPAGGELPVKSTLCDTVRGTRQSIVIDHVALDPVYRDHHTPATYGLQSYIAVPILLEDGELFGTLCAIDPHPRRVDTPEIRGMFDLFAQLIAQHVERIRQARSGRVERRTLEQRVDKALAEKKVYADIIEDSPAAVTALGLDWRVLAINRANQDAFEGVFGKRPQIGDHFLELFELPEHVEQQRAIWSRALGGEAFVVVDDFGDEQIDKRSYEVRFTPLHSRSGERIGATSTSYDVTDRVRAARELAAAQDQLRQAQKMDAMGQLTGGVAHDFNNLLTPIVASLDILQRKGVGGEREQRLIGAAIQSAERARVLVQRLLAFARRQPLQSTAVDVPALVDGMAALLASTLGPQIHLAVEIAPGLPRAHADPNQLEMALLNLGVNARDAMPDGGALTIAASAERAVAGDGLAAGDYVRLSVADTGSGMDAATLSRATEPFYSTKGVSKGTGLGLSMVEGLARQLGGALRIHSRPGEGTRIELWLPVSQAAPAEAGVRGEAAGVANAGLALLVDDEELVRLSTAEMLADLGYRVIEAASAEEALARLAEGAAPDILITDHLMPGMNGVELIQRLARDRPGLPTIIISGYAEHEGLDSGYARLTKPFRLEELSAALEGARG